ncbi:MAG: cbb3-type cytochrome oxidase assembly protein CcoS [Bacteroidetes bacterium]|nr:cbb3-type cytochrome oxidase assembly protein CcoS [Bacteroidota bacterium]MBS1539671.1 cbb3-type cytochrome oxidase assembly protein CcoS [Bacteroidota bacterium]
MNIIVGLILISLVIAVIFLFIFFWSVRSGQYEDTYTPSVRILFDNELKNQPTKKALTDIETRQHVMTLVNAFYDDVKADALLGPVFSHVDWPTHLPTMYNFWSSMLLGDQSYDGNPFQKHKPLPIQRQHFTRWLTLFTATVDRHFSGTKADEAKMRAQSIAGIFQHKLGIT